MQPHYVHGYAPREGERLADQADVLEPLLHEGVRFPPGSTVLELGCGVGAQTAALLRRSPGIALTAVDIAAASLSAAAARLLAAQAAGKVSGDSRVGEVTFLQADARALPCLDQAFDHAFLCFLLEHLPDPGAALRETRRVLKPGGTITVVEGDHGSVLFHPEDPDARAVIACQVELQRRAGGDARLGRRLGALLRDAGFAAVTVEPRLIYADGGRPDLGEMFTRRTLTAMVAGVREAAVSAGLVSDSTFGAGLRALEHAAGPEGSFAYTFFRATARTG